MGKEAPRDLLMFVDTETNGIPVDQTASYKNIDNWPRIKQISWLIYDKEEQLYASHNYVISEEDASIQINRSDYVPKTVLPIHQVLRRFLNFLRYCDVIVGHNIQYDVQVILSELFRFGMDTDKLSSMHQFCTMKNGVNACGFDTRLGDRYPKLQELYSKLFHQPFENEHDAYCDIKATAECFWTLFSDGYLRKEDFPFLLTKKEEADVIEKYIDVGNYLVEEYIKRGCLKTDERLIKALSVFDKALQFDSKSDNTKKLVGEACLKCADDLNGIVGMSLSSQFYKKAAEAGSGKALAVLASHSYDKDEKKKLYLKAIEQGWIHAAYALSFFYEREGDLISAEKYSKMWMKYCEDNFDSLPTGYAASYIRCFMFGELGHTTDYRKAESLCKRSIANGNDNYALYATLLELCGEWEKRFEILNQDLTTYKAGVEKSLNSTIFSRHFFSEDRALSKAFDDYDKNLVKKLLPIIECYLEGLGTEKNYKKAKELIDEGITRYRADGEDSDKLHFYRGEYYEKGYGVVSVSFEKAFQDYKSASNHIAEAKKKVGIMYLEGKGCIKDKKLARVYLEEAKSRGIEVSPYLERAKSWF